MKDVLVPGGSIGIRESTDVDTGVPEGLSSVEPIDWAKKKREKEDADSKDATVQSLIDDVQALKATVKAAPGGNLTLTKAQTLVLVRGLLFVLKGDKT